MNTNQEIQTNKKISISYKGLNGTRKYVHGDDVYELIDGLEALEDGRFINKFLNDSPNLDENQLRELDRIILNTNDAIEIARYAVKRKKLFCVRGFEDKLIYLRQPFELISFAKGVEGVDIERVEQAIIKLRNPEAIIRFYEQVEGACFEECRDALFKLEAVEHFGTLFTAKKLPIINANDLFKAEKIIIESGDRNAIVKWVRSKCSVQTTQLENIIAESNNPEAIFYYSYYVECSNKHKLRKAMMQTKDKYWIREWKRYFGIQGLFY